MCFKRLNMFQENTTSLQRTISWNTIESFVTKYHVDTIEFSPNGQIAVCGSYELDENKNERLGQLSVYSKTTGPCFHLSHVLDSPGLLDLCWLNDSTVLGAQADGEAALWQFSSISHVNRAAIDFHVTDTILLSTQTAHGKILFSDSAGWLHLWNVSTSEPTCMRSHRGHEFEAWCVTGDVTQEAIYYSGGDDGFCYVWDMRNFDSKPVLCFKHEVGVCSVVAQPLGANIISTGCYDGFLRLWDLRMQRDLHESSDPLLLLCSANGGGIWRHKWLANRFVIMAAMHAGFLVVGPITLSQLHRNPVTLEPLACYRPSAKLAYGIDGYIQSAAHDQIDVLIASCSFYDNTVDFSQLSISSGL